MVKVEHTSNKWTQLNIWDTLGQEKFKSLAPLFFRKAIGAFLVFDCTSRESFDALESWFQQLSNSADTRVIIMLLGNKSDLPNRQVPYNVAMEYARARNFGYLEVSAKTGMNVRNAFNCLVRTIYRNTADYVPEEVVEAVSVKKHSEASSPSFIQRSQLLPSNSHEDKRSNSLGQPKQKAKKTKKDCKC